MSTATATARSGADTARRPPGDRRRRAAPAAAPAALSASLTFGWRAMLKIKHVPEQLLDVTVTPIMFMLMFTYLFGGAIAGSTGDYLHFSCPGILVMSVLFTTVYSGVALNTDLTKGVVDRFRSLPIWRPAPLVGALLGDSVRYVVAGTVIIVARRGPRLPARTAGVLGACWRRSRWWSSSRSACPGSSRRSACCCAPRTR